MTIVTRIFLVALALSVVFFALLTFYNKNPLRKVWVYDGRFSVLDTESFTVTSYPKDKTTIITISLPTDIYIEVPGGYGNYKLEDVYELGRSEKKGDDLLVQSVSDLLGLPIETTKNQMSYWDQYEIWQINKDEELLKRDIDLSDYPVTVTQKRTDESEIERFDKAKIDFYFEDTFWERSIRDEDYTVGVYNASGIPGLAANVSRILETVGFRVVNVSNWDEDGISENCQIRLRDDEKLSQSSSVERLEQITSCSVTIGGDPTGRFDMQLVVSSAI